MPLVLVAVMPQVKLMAVILVPHVARVMTATMAAMPAARGHIARGREYGGGERNHGNGGYEG